MIKTEKAEIIQISVKLTKDGHELGEWVDDGSAEGKVIGHSWIEIQKDAAIPNRYNIVNDNITHTYKSSVWACENRTILVFEMWSDNVTDLDNGKSDASKIWDYSQHVQYGELECILDTQYRNYFLSPSVDLIREFLSLVGLNCYAGEDV